jgi:uncharacterized membrane protein YfcA
VIWLFAIAAGAGMVGGMLGMAGGIFVVPILTLFGGVDFHTAVGASLVSVIACSCATATPFLRAGLTNLRLAIVLETATTTGALTGVVLAGVLAVPVLQGLFAAILVVSAYQMRARRRVVVASAGGPDPLHLASTYPEAGADVPYVVERVPLGLGLMYGAGMLSALLGIGSGVLKIPAMDSALRLPIKVSSATSSLMIGVTAAASAGVYFVRGELDPVFVGPIVLGSVAGAWVGARILIAVSGDYVRMMFVGVLALLAVQMGLAAAGIDVVGMAR